jgi:hypothetical protein
VLQHLPRLPEELRPTEWDPRGGERARLLYGEVATACRSCGRMAVELEWLYHENAALAWDELEDEAGWAIFCTGCARLNEFIQDAS